MALSCAEIAARIHADMCNDDSNGYSWEPRHGEDGKGIKTLTIDGKTYSYDRGSWDCSSSVCHAWQEAIKYTKYAGSLDAAVNTYTMREVFTASGLFSWKPMSFIAARGDVYLGENTHTAMCQSQEPDVMSEFCINENGEVYGGRVGDQTGAEAAINPFREEFDGILHYNGKADNSTTHTTAPAQPRYRVKGIVKWGAWKSCGQSALSKNGIYDVEFSGLPKGSWFRLRLKGGEWLPKNAHNKTKTPVIAITLYYATANPDTTGYYEIVYRGRLKKNKAWLAWKVDDNHGGTSNGKDVLDCLQAKIRKC